MNHELILKNVSRFIELNREEQDLYLALLTEKVVKKKDFLLRPGELAKYSYFVTKGCLKVYNIDQKGAEHINMFAVEDWWTGDLAGFLTQQPATYFIQALEESIVLQISKERYNLLFEKVPKFERFYRMLYEKSLATYVQRANQGISFNAEERYLNFAEKYPSLLNRISQKNIASYVGVTPEFLSVLRKKLAKQ